GIEKDGYFFRYKIDCRNDLVVRADMTVRLGGAVVVVKCHARRHDIQKGKAFVRHGGLDHGDELRFVSTEASPHEGGAQFEGHANQVDGIVGVGYACFADRAYVCSG